MIGKQEIEKIYDYVQKHKVKYVDVQIELVDHLATEIERIRSENPTIDFQSALEKASSAFDVKTYNIWPNFREIRYVNGFKNLVIQKEKQTYKYLNSRIHNYFLSFFKLPKVILTISLWLLIYYLIQNGNAFNVLMSVFVFQLLALLYWGLKTYLFQKSYGKFSSINFQFIVYSSFTLFVFSYNVIESFKWVDGTTIYFPIIFSTVSVFLILATYIAFIYFTDLLISEIKEKYGNHKLTIG